MIIVKVNFGLLHEADMKMFSTSVEFEFECRFYALSAFKANFRARTYRHVIT